MASKSGNDDDHNYELENEVLRRRIESVDKLIDMEEERRENSERASAELRVQIEALSEGFREQDRLLFSSIGALSLRNAEAKMHYQQLIQSLQKQIQAAERDVALAEQDVATTRCLKEKELQNAKDALHHLEAELERMTFQFAELLNDTTEKLAERISMSQGSWAAEQKRTPLELRMKEESPIVLANAVELPGDGGTGP
ncbi:hypothetical protein, conserved [Eimeria maxima]|uniref:Coiled-coil domain-containing protein 153 n=1 Tax=Eimeria maxima TaxID=5804 RepID=U6MIE2_EIMMA|nr:hypothetical protein, conserved [Eimeria maxima]CDJ61420.1 hypothetical protein, conserved [Eimeria maxima]